MSKVVYEFFECAIIARLERLLEESTGGAIGVSVLKKDVEGETLTGVSFQFYDEDYLRQAFPDRGVLDVDGYMVVARPTIFLQQVYAEHEAIEFYDIGKIAKEIIAMLYDAMSLATEEFMEQFDTTPKIKEEVLPLVTAKLLNWYTTSDSLKHVPYRQWNDLVVLYAFMTDSGEELFVTSKLTEKLGITEEELYTAAMENMVEKVRLMPISQMVSCLTNEECTEPYPDGVKEPYCCGFKDEPYGAISFLLPGMIERMQERVGKQFYIFPSSIHEVMVQPLEGCEIWINESSVEEWNQNMLDSSERLTNQAYFYNGTEFEPVFDNPAPII